MWKRARAVVGLICGRIARCWPWRRQRILYASGNPIPHERVLLTHVITGLKRVGDQLELANGMLAVMHEDMEGRHRAAQSQRDRLKDCVENNFEFTNQWLKRVAGKASGDQRRVHDQLDAMLNAMPVAARSVCTHIAKVEHMLREQADGKPGGIAVDPRKLVRPQHAKAIRAILLQHVQTSQRGALSRIMGLAFAKAIRDGVMLPNTIDGQLDWILNATPSPLVREAVQRCRESRK